MTEKTKPKESVQKDKESEAKKKLVETEEFDEAVWSRDQQEKGYYYDDAHGYEIYNPEEDEEEG